MKHGVKTTTKALTDNIFNGWEYNVVQVAMEHLAEMHEELIIDAISDAEEFAGSRASLIDMVDAESSLEILTGLVSAQSKLNNIYGHWNNSLWSTLRANVKKWKVQIKKLRSVNND